MRITKVIPDKPVVLSYVPRKSIGQSIKVQPSPNEEKSPRISNDVLSSIRVGIESNAHQPQSLELKTTPRSSSYDTKAEPETTSTFVSETDKSSSIATKSLSDSSKPMTMHPKRWFSTLTSEQRKFLKLFIPILLFTLVTASVLTPVLIVTLHQSNLESSFTNMTASVCISTTCIGHETPYKTSMVTVLYPFDGNALDTTGYAAGTEIGSSGGFYAAVCYVGSKALNLGGSATQQYIQIPYVNLSQRSFTIEFWINPSMASVIGDFGIFGQCDLSDICLLISMRNGRIALSFDSMNTTNNTLISASFPPGYWSHVAIVYDSILLQQLIYNSGQIDAMSNGLVAPFQGASSGSITTIGRSRSSAYDYTFFQGQIDHFVISAGSVRTDCEVYNDASLTAYFPFDSNGTLQDYSVNLFNGIGAGLTLLSQGRIGQAIYFGTNSSYFQAQCFPELSISNPPFTVALWINPASNGSGGSVVHVSDLQNGNGTCYDLLVLTSSGALVVQLLQSATVVNTTQGPSIRKDTWTHITVVFSSQNGVRIFINGKLTSTSRTTGSLSIINVNNPQYVTLGNNNPFGISGSIVCHTGSIPVVSGPFVGAIDEFRLYNRELNNQEICVLAGM